jgi:hypothetical protein
MRLMTLQVSLGEIVEAFYEELVETYGDEEVALMMAQTLANELLLQASHGDDPAPLLGVTAGPRTRSASGPRAAGDARDDRRTANARRLATAARVLSPRWKAGRQGGRRDARSWGARRQQAG